MSKKVTVAFAGGGTGGHIYPGLAVADSLRESAKKFNVSIEVYWIGSSKGMDKTIVEKNVDANGVSSADVFYGIPAGKLRRYFSFSNFIDIFKIFAGFFASLFILVKTRPVLLFSKGGFVSVPPCAAARVLGIPVFTHESDFTPGLATKLNSVSAKNIFVSTEDTIRYLSVTAQKKAVVTGNPVRPVFYSASKKRGLDFLGINDVSNECASKPLLVVVGGSSGALQINMLVQENLGWLCERFVVVHQTGKKSVSGAKGGADVNGGLPFSSANQYKPYEFIYSEMPDVLSAADVVLSRAGANSLWECAVLAKPLVLVPLCGSGTRGDQEDNAKYFADRGAAIVLGRDCADSEHLKAALSEMCDVQKRADFAKAAGALAAGERASSKIADLIIKEIVKIDEVK